MTPIAWLGLAAAAAAGAYLVGWRALQGYRSREARDLNAERYLAWRGRARPPSASPASRQGMTAEERRGALIGAALALVALAALIGFLVSS